MKTFNYKIQDELGIHARPAGMLVKEAQKYRSEIKIRKGEKETSAVKLLMVMGLGVKQGDEVSITIDGSDEVTAYDALQVFFQTYL